ncbi:hypothetical protein JRO89_XS03G0003800 [Xanthoceras sorbifolium]|uniref:RNase H type-1 domain-containing protein n=1 Tax=Xanthoceras sorbifolium TaxID=99658 RepID=A0ABQ8I7X9_9ROSI|nr:hypothetical protein JRO89_XS03G0003800 [Xanthoceras sorbifolium]
MRAGLAKVRRVLAVVEFYHSLIRRDSRRDYDASTTEVGKTRATPPVAGETNQRRKRRTSGGGDEPAVRETNERRGSNATCTGVDFVDISYAPRSSNFVAHSIAKWALGRFSSTVWEFVFPPRLRKISDLDVSAFFCPGG